MSKLAESGLSLLHHILRVEKAAECVSFYTEKFGMSLVAEIEGTLGRTYMLSFRAETQQKYDKQVGFLELFSPKLTPKDVKLVNHGERDGVYWKIAVNLPNVNTAVTQLQKNGVSVSPGSQFRDIGFLTHLADPDKYAIELLQFTFEGSIADHKSLPDHPLRQQPVFGLITLRVTDIEKSLKFYRDTLGMKLLCREDVSMYGFVLYFLAFTTEEPPSSDINAVENREWLYQRPYTVLELQICDDKQQRKFKPLDENSFGFMGMGLGCNDVMALKKYLEESHGLKTYDSKEKHEIFNAPSFMVCDPDDIPIRIVQYDSS